MIGLGLAQSAKHVLDDHRKALENGDDSVVCLGMRPGAGLDIWKCHAIQSETDGGDLQLLSLTLVSDWPSDGRFEVLQLTTPIPPPGEILTVAGFRFGQPKT